MCGIVGVLSKSHSFNKSQVRGMLNKISHRGPDDEGVVAISTKNNKVKDSLADLYLGHRRLSILDLSSLGHQPMPTTDKKLWITYNGEIFNFIEIRNILINKGYKFISNTDTEVVLNAYREYGRDCLKMFRGFFAFCIYDFEKKELFLARDRLGSKPLRYYFDGNLFSFSSEIKALLEIESIDKSLDYFSISQYLSLKYIPAPNTIFKSIKKLPAGSYLVFDIRKNNFVINKYWEPEFEPKVDISYDEAKQKTQEILKDSVNIRMISDVPVGVLLSGGVDSSSIVASLSEQTSQINTFSVGFSDSKFDERSFSRRIAKQFNTNHHEFVVEPDLNLDLEKIICNFDEPFADSSQVPTYLLCKAAKKEVTVALSGDAGDEIFGGYNRYIWTQKIWNNLSVIPYPLRNFLSKSALKISESSLSKLDAIIHVKRSGQKIHKSAKSIENINSNHDLFKNIVVKNLKTNVYIYSAISFIISVSILFCSNGFTLADSALV